MGWAKDDAALNANLQLFDIAGVAAALILHTNKDKLDGYDFDDDDGIIAVGDIPWQPPHAPPVVDDTANDDDDVDEDEDDNDLLDEDDKDELAAATNAHEGNKFDGNQGVWRSQRRGKGTRKKYADYSLLMAARRARRGGQRRALIQDRCVFFSSDDLSDAKPIPEEDTSE